MILNTGGRTDTVNYYSDWLINRFNAGFVYSRNPLFQNHVVKYQLNPAVVDCVIFCSKNYEPILSRIKTITDKFNVFCHYTIRGYGKDIEPNVPTINESIKTLVKLSKKVGKEKIAWRYDPVLLTSKYTVQNHLETFELMASKIADYVVFSLFSFVEMDKRFDKTLPELIPFTDKDKISIIKGLGAIGKKFNLPIQTCGNDENYEKYGITNSSCITSVNLERALQCKFKKVAHKGTRKGCHCMPSRDIGWYNTCLNGCRYCYANKKPEQAIENYKKHDKISPLLIGQVEPSDIIKDGNQPSFIIKEKLLFQNDR